MKAIAGILQLAFSLFAPQNDEDKPTLNIVAAGINSRGSGLFDAVSHFAGSGKSYRIVLESEHPIEYVQWLADQGDDPKGTEVIFVKGADDPRLNGFIREINRRRNATVNIDMDLVMFGRAPWDDQTTKLKDIAVRIAEERAKVLPQSQNTFLAHSAGTIGLSKVIEAGKGGLFQRKIAASPQTWALSSDTLILHATTDAGSTATGDLTDLKLDGAASRDVQGWLGHGNKVIQVETPGLAVRPSEVDTALLKTALSVGEQLKGHRVTWDLAATDRRMIIHIPVIPVVEKSEPNAPPSPMRAESFELANGRVGQVARIVSEAKAENFSRKEMEDGLRKLEPPEGGGIALRATAILPVSAEGLSGARWDESGRRIFLQENNKDRWGLPVMDPELARVAYACVFEEGIDPEFSIGVDPLGKSNDPAPRGKQAAYYVGPVEGTKFGFILLQADIALGEIVYGGTSEIKARGLDKIEGYQSLPELYPAKYTDQPLAARLLGGNERVVIESLPTVLREKGDRELEYAAGAELAVRFGRTTPAEAGYADLFRTLYDSILAKVDELRELVRCARAVALFKWLRENRIKLDAPALVGVKPRNVFTPHSVDIRSAPKIETIVRRSPFIEYGEYGPTAIRSRSGLHTTIAYDEWGQVRFVRRSDGKTLQTYADSLGKALAFETTDVGAAAFSYEQDATARILIGSKLRKSESIPAGIEGNSSESAATIGRPWELVETAVRRLLREP